MSASANSKSDGASTTAASFDPTDNNTSTTALINQVEYIRQVLVDANIQENADGIGDIATLLKQVDAADQVAQGVETKLDKILEDLEELLKGFDEAEGEEGAKEEGKEEIGEAEEVMGVPQFFLVDLILGYFGTVERVRRKAPVSQAILPQ